MIFDCFFDETFARLERSGLQSRQKRRDVIDHLNAIILGTSKGMRRFYLFVLLMSVCMSVYPSKHNSFVIHK